MPSSTTSRAERPRRGSQSSPAGKRRSDDARVPRRRSRGATRLMSLIPDGPVLLSLEDGVARLRLNRPEASNGLSEALLEGLVEATRMAEEAEGIRCVLFSGEGKNFCAGGDV